MAKSKRFEITERQSANFNRIEVITDTKTGVQYLLVTSQSNSVLTPLLNTDGSPSIVEK